MAQPISEQEFMKLPPAEQERLLGQMEQEQQFSALPPQDQEGVLKVMEATQQAQPGQLEAGARGAAQGLSLGFADEIIGGLSAAGKQFIETLQTGAPPERMLQERIPEEIATQRTRDIASEAQFPKTFGAAELGGAVAGAAVAPGAAIGRGAGVVGRGLAGIAKSAGLSALTAAGKSESKLGSRELKGEMEKSALIGAGVQAAASALIPGGRVAGKIAVRAPGVAGAVATGGKTTALKAGLDVALKGMSPKEAITNRLSALKKVLDTPEGKIPRALEKSFDLLEQSLNTQGSAGLLAAHGRLLQDPTYRKFLEKESK